MSLPFSTLFVRSVFLSCFYQHLNVLFSCCLHHPDWQVYISQLLIPPQSFLAFSPRLPILWLTSQIKVPAPVQASFCDLSLQPGIPWWLLLQVWFLPVLHLPSRILCLWPAWNALESAQCAAVSSTALTSGKVLHHHQASWYRQTSWTTAHCEWKPLSLTFAFLSIIPSPPDLFCRWRCSRTWTQSSSLHGGDCSVR